MSARNGPRLTPDAPAFPGFLTPPSTIVDVLLAPGPAGGVVYDYGLLLAGEPGVLHCPCGRTDHSQRAEDAISAHLDGSPVGTRAAILARSMANDGTIGPAYLYAVAERGATGVTWPTYHGIRPAGRRPDPGSTTIVRTA